MGTASGFFVAVGASGTTATSPDGIDWASQTPVFLRGPTDLASDGKAWIAVGTYETARSPDGDAWFSHSGPAFNGVAAAQGKYVAVGRDGISTSPEGVNWTLRASLTTAGLANPVEFHGVAFGKDGGGNPLWVAVGGNRAIMTSPDGVTWTSQGSPPISGTPVTLNRVAYGGGAWVAVGFDGQGGGHMMTSTDGITWMTLAIGKTNPTGVAYGNGQWAVVGGATLGTGPTLFTSSGGPGWSWNQQALPGAGSSIAYDGATWVVVGGGGVFSSPGGPLGSTWLWVTAAKPPGVSFGAVAWDNQWVAVGTPTPANGPASILTSPDAKTWTPHILSNRTLQTLNGVAYGQNQWVAVGDGGTILSSRDGTVWTPHGGGTAAQLHGIAYDGTQWVAVGAGTILTSADAKAWTQRCPSPPGSGTGCPGQGVDGIATDGSQWVAVGGNVISNSTDAIHWTRQTFLGDSFTGIAHGGGLWMVVGFKSGYGAVLTSAGPSTGWTWTQQNLGTGTDLYHVEHEGNLWLVGGSGGVEWTSADNGLTWTGTDLLWGSNSDTIYAAATDGRQWVATGWVGPGAAVYHSANASSWSKAADAPGYLYGVAATPLPTCSPAEQTLFVGETASFAADGGTPAYTWTAPGSSNLGPDVGSSFSTSYAEAGLHAVTVTDAASPPQSAQCAVNVLGYPACTPATQSVLPEEPVVFNAGGGVPGYTWSAPGATSPGPAVGASFSTSYAAPGSYAVRFTDSEASPGSALCQVVVSSPPVPPPSPPPPPPAPSPRAPQHGSAKTSGQAGPPPADGVPGPSGGGAQAGPAQTVAGVAPPRPSGTAVTLHDAAPEPLTLLATPEGQLLVGFQANRDGGSFGWDFGDASPLDAHAAPTHRFATPGTYTVRLVVMDADGHLEATSRAVLVSAAPPAKVASAQLPAPARGWAMATLGVVGAALGAALVFALRGGWPYVILVFFSRLRNSDVARHPVRAAILDILGSQPGIHELALSRLVARDHKTVAYHLRVLCAAGLVRKQKWEGTVGYWLQPPEGKAVEPGQSALRRPNAQRLLGIIRTEPGLTPQGLAARSGLSARVVRYHVGRLGKAGLVAARPEGQALRIFALGG